MKRVLFIAFILLCPLFNLYSVDYKVDKIYIFLESFQNGKKCEGVTIFNLEINKIDRRVAWTLKEVEISNSSVSKVSTVNSFYSTSEMKSSRIGKIKWQPGEYFECEYYVTNSEKPFILKAKKIAGTRYKWDVYGLGVMVIDGKEQKFEMKGKTKFDLKYKKLVIPYVLDK